MTAVLKHELRAYFHSLTAYVFGAFLLAFVGIGAMMYNLQAAVSNFEYVLSFGCLVFVVIVPKGISPVSGNKKKSYPFSCAALVKVIWWPNHSYYF